MKTSKIPLLFAAPVALALAGCAHLGPKTVAADRFDYNSAIGESWKQQTLLNIVKLRYVDIPVFVDVASIVSGYSMETSVSVGGEVFPSVDSDKMAIGGAGRFTDRPTITYIPKTGEKFLRSLLMPIDPKNIFFLVQSGYSADFIFGLSVDAINGVRNRSASALLLREADPDFMRALQLLREIQAAGVVGMRVEVSPAKDQTAVLFFRQDGLPPDIMAKANEVRRLLKLAPEQNRYVITYSPIRGTDDELAVTSRSMLQIMTTFSTFVEAPDAHQLQAATAGDADAALVQNSAGLMRIRSGEAKPANAFVAVRYRNRWFWIDDNDVLTKRALNAIMLLFTLTDDVGGEALPLITIPAQ
jgi:hypothetical protein